jgi:signal peptidase I
MTGNVSFPAEERGTAPSAGAEERTAGGSPHGAGAKSRAAPASPSVLRELVSLLAKIAAIAFAAALALTFVYGLHRNADANMVPAVMDGDLVMFYRLDRDYDAGDLLILGFRGERQVRRVVATAGDTVDVTENGLIINGALQRELNIYGKTERYEEGAELPVTLGENEVFVLGDSRENATDSRVYGAVNAKDTMGTVIAVVRRRNL